MRRHAHDHRHDGRYLTLLFAIAKLGIVRFNLF
jgi:hypothetical protein